MSFCMNFDLSLNVLFQNQPYFLQKISTNQAMKKNITFHLEKIYIFASLLMYFREQVDSLLVSLLI